MQDDTANQTPSIAPLGTTLPPQENTTPMPMDTTMPTPPPFESAANPISPVVEPMATVSPADQPIAAPEATQDMGGGFPQVIDGSETPPPPPVINGGTTPTTPTFVPEKSGGKGRGKIIATIFGILLLVGGVGTGLVLVQQQQLFRQKAGSCTEGYLSMGGCCADGKRSRTYRFTDCSTENRCDWNDGSCHVAPQPTAQPTAAPTNPPGPGTPTCDGKTGTHCNTDQCHQFTCTSSGWRDDGAGGVCCSQSACSSNAACTSNNPTPTPPPTGGNCGSTPNGGYACNTLLGLGVGCVRCADGSYYDVSDANTGCPSQCRSSGTPPPEETPPPNTRGGCVTSGNTCSNSSSSCVSNADCPGGTCICNYVTPPNCVTTLYQCPGVFSYPAGGCGSNPHPGTTSFESPYCGLQQLDFCNGQFTSKVDRAGCTTTTPTPTPPGQTNPPGGPTPTPPGPSAVCLEVKAWDTDWNQLTAAQLSALSAGDVVRFTVKGSASSGTFDMARFTINTVLGSNVTDTKPTTGEYYYEYTIPTGVTSFTIKGEIHHVSLGWR